MDAARPRIAVLTLYTPNVAAYATIGVANHAEYCRRNGYEFICEPDSLDASRPPHWSKLLLLQRHLDRFDWLFWIDADALFMNSAVRVESRADPAYNLIMAGKNPGSPRLCTGEILIRGCEWSRWFLDLAWRTPAGGPWLEQSAMISLMDRPDVSPRLKILPFGGMSRRTYNYRSGDWIIHFPAASTSARTRLMSSYASRIPAN